MWLLVTNVNHGTIQLLLVLLAMMDGLFQMDNVHQVVQVVILSHKLNLIVEVQIMEMEIMEEAQQLVTTDKFLLEENVLM